MVATDQVALAASTVSVERGQLHQVRVESRQPSIGCCPCLASQQTELGTVGVVAAWLIDGARSEVPSGTPS